MMTFEVSDDAREYFLHLEGRLTMDDLSAHVDRLDYHLQRVSPGFVVVIDYAELDAFQPEAAGVMMYLARRVFSSKPGAFLLCNGGKVVHAPLRKFMETIDRRGVLRFFETLEEARAYAGTIRCAA